MFLRYFRFKQAPYTSPASRYLFRIKPYRMPVFAAKKLTFYKKSNSGRNDSGRIIIWSKAAVLKKIKSYQINYSFRYIKSGFVANIQFLPFKNKIISLIQFANGSLTYIPTLNRHRLFRYFHIFKPMSSLFRSSINPFFNCFVNLNQHRPISLLELSIGRGAQYVRSFGTKAKIIKIDIKNILALVYLPSGQKKAFSCFSLATQERVIFKEYRNFLNSKAGYWRNFGCKPTVRGVAMNPVDHPHGGRTKAIRYQRTPWGKTTKFK